MEAEEKELIEIMSWTIPKTPLKPNQTKNPQTENPV